MKLRPEEMALFELNYGDLLRPAYQILLGRGRGQCANQTSEYLVVYGPKHDRENSIFDTSPYVLPPGKTTPDRWDCKGFLVPSDRELGTWRGPKRGPRAVKFWDFRRFWVTNPEGPLYRCSWHNGLFLPSQINWAIPNFPYEEVLRRIKSMVAKDGGPTRERK